jgi:hypothetical protein
MIKGYKETGKKFFVHGNRGRKPAHSLDDSLKQNIVDLYRTKYQGSNITHFSELLNEFEGIKVSSTTIRSILLQKFILSPKAKRSSRKALHAKLTDMKKKSKSKKQTAEIQSAILDIQDAHPRHPRCAYFGELIQMDASVHHWFGRNKTQLHIAVDDATYKIVN